PPKAGTLLEVAGWVAPPGTPLRVSVARAARSTKSVAELARRLNGEAKARGIAWVADPVRSPASYVLRWAAGGWERVGPDGAVVRVGADDDDAVAAVAAMPPATSLFVQLPVPAAIADAIDTES